ncbi:peptidase T [Romboutsia sp.]|uniref:peptidase T n=1 Tax=Romboutsia sp. TaxID=1965302 RepID=UPI003F380BA1
MESVVNKFLKYVKYDTTADNDSTTIPSTKSQLALGNELVKELKDLNIKDVSIDEHGFVIATIPSNIDKEIPTIGFIAHIDTAPDFTGLNVNPQIVENYNGEDILLNEKLNIVLSPKQFPELKNYEGKTLITTDGTTLLGADDKAGIAEIMTAVEYLIENPEIPHGEIKIAFTPDEEIDNSAVNIFDVEKFGADIAYTVDGDVLGEINYENFNAAQATITISGRSVHPGEAKDKMINALLVGNEFISKLPQDETPSHTEGHEGFFHLCTINGDVEYCVLDYMIRDFDKINFENRKELLLKVTKDLNEKYENSTVKIDIKDDYYNMKDKIEPVMYSVDIALKAVEDAGVKPIIRPIRGGTDGSVLSFKGLPTPNIFIGGHNYHGRYEFIPTYAMEKAVEVIINIVKAYAAI